MVIVQCVVNGFALAPEPHELGILEHPQLMAHRRLAQRHRICNVLHAQLVVVQCIQDLDAGGVAEHPEQVGQLVQHLVVRHIRAFRLQGGRGVFCLRHVDSSFRSRFI